jgi:hypothetical protein
MAISVPPFISITSLSESNNFGTSETNVFVSSSYSLNGFGYNVLSSSISYNTAAGHFSASEGGFYQIIMNSIWGRGETATVPGTTDYTRTIKFYKNDTVFYTAAARYDYGDYAFGAERTFHTVVSMSANDGIKITATATAGADSFLSGSNLIIRKIDSDFAYTAKQTNSTALTGTVVSYFSGALNTDYITGSSVMTITPGLINGGFTVQNTGSYYTFFTNVLDDTTSGDNWMTESINVGSFPDFSFPIAERTLFLDTATAVDQRSLINIATVDGDAVPVPIQLQITTDTNGATGFSAKAGTAISMMKIPRNAIMPIAFNAGTSSFISTTGSTNLLATSFLAGTTEDGSTVEMTFNSGSGIITIPSGGLYHLSYNIKVYNSHATSDASVQFQVRRGCTNCTDGTIAYQGRTGVGSVTDPINYTLTTIVSASNNDTLTICARDFVTGSGNKVYVDTPSWFYLYRIDTYIPDALPPDLFPKKETAGSASFDSNYTINSYQISNQYTRASDQVPFYLGTPGPLSIRGRTLTGSITFTS